ncbi:MAG: hypothetical protein KDB88_05525 [Flavobacteriales bacterium]|nr:hypothetical protein [Flavobacteriales bacterium]
MKAGKRMLKLVAMSVGLVSVAALLGFVESTSESMPVNDIRIEVQGLGEVQFIDEAMVRNIMLTDQSGIMGVPLGRMDLRVIEDRLREVPAIANAEVYSTMDGVLHVKVDQRVPLVRVMMKEGKGLYLDRNGYAMPTSPVHSPRVLVALGAVRAPDVSEQVRHVLSGDSTWAGTHLPGLYRLAKAIDADPQWRSLFDQVVVHANGQFELIPIVGMHHILIGDGSDLDHRLEKLRIFYDKGLHQADSRRYSTIDLRFADQVVCTKRPTL